MANEHLDSLVWVIVNVVLTGIFIKPLFILWLVSLCLGRRKDDHARVGFTWMKLVSPFYILALLLYVGGGVVFIFLDPWFNGSGSSDYDEDTMNLLQNIYTRLYSVGNLFDDVATALLLVTLVEIGNGFLYVLTQTRTALHKGIRWAAVSVGSLIVVVSIARLGLQNAAWGAYFDSLDGNDNDFSVDTFVRNLQTVNRLSTAVFVLFWAMTLPLIAYASYVVHRVKGVPLLQSSSVIFLVSTILLFVRYTWQLVYVVIWILPNKQYPLAIDVVDPLLTFWVMFVLLVLLFVISIRKKRGLWTTYRPWMNRMSQQLPAYIPGQGSWVQGGAYMPPQQYPQQQYVYTVPPQQQGWVQQQPTLPYAQEVHGSSSPYLANPGTGTPELGGGENREK